MLNLEIGIDDVERLLARAGHAIPLRIEGGRLIAKKFGVDVAVGPPLCNANTGEVDLRLEVVGAFRGSLGRMAAKKVLFGKLRGLDLPELTVDEGRSPLRLDGRGLLRRRAPAYADYSVAELLFRQDGGRGVVALRAVAADDATG